MPNKKKILNLLKKILKTDEFSESSRYEELLEYLVKASIQGHIPKEIKIAKDVFCKPADVYKKSSSEVRVYVHNLRKKLDSYYQHEGKDDEIVFEIPKGHYKVTFNKKKSKKQLISKNTLIILNIIFILGIFTINFFIIRNFRNNLTESEISDNPFWEDICSDDKPVMIVIGDYYLYKAENLFGIDRHLYIRDFNINSDKDFEEALNKFDIGNKKVKKTNHTLVGKYAPWTICEISKLLYSKDFELKLSSNLQWQDLNRYNIIFIGTYKSFGILNELISHLNFSYQVSPNRLFYHDEDKDSTFTYISEASTIENAYETDYSTVIKLPTANKTSIMIFGSTRDIGCIAMVKYLTNKETLSAFETKYKISHPKNQYFESIFKIQGYKRNVSDIDILHFDTISY